VTQRGATAPVIAEVALAANAPIHLFELYLTGATTYATDAAIAISWNGHTYPAVGTLIGFDGVEETTDLTIGQARITLAAVDQSLIATLLTYELIDRQLVIRKGFLNSSSGVLVDPIPIFDGRCDAPVINEDPDAGSCTITLSASSQWIDFERTPGRKTNSADQQLWFPGDLGFEYVSQLSRDITWGKTTPVDGASGGGGRMSELTVNLP
jgi:hypothetical protein